MKRSYLTDNDIMVFLAETRRDWGDAVSDRLRHAIRAHGPDDDIQLYTLRDDCIKQLGAIKKWTARPLLVREDPHPLLSLAKDIANLEANILNLARDFESQHSGVRLSSIEVIQSKLLHAPSPSSVKVHFSC